MRMIGSIPDADDAERFSDYLLTQQIDNMVEESSTGNGWTVWVEHDDDVDRGKSELEHFLANRGHDKYGGASVAAKRIREQAIKAEKKRRAKYIDVRTRWGQASQWAAPVTIALIAFAIAVSVGTRLGQQIKPVGEYLLIASFDTQDEQEIWNALMKRLAEKDITKLTMRDFIPDPGLGQIAHGQVWRLVTPIFLHFGILHLLFNVFWVRDLGGMIETQRGSLVMLALVLMAAVISNLVEYWWSGPWFGGLSGVVYALFGYLWVKQRYEPHLGLGVNQQTVWIMMGWLLVCLTGMVGDIANAAHVMGLAVGAAFAYAPTGWRRAMKQRQM